jgi:glycosyltransferase involved in cell wall biosynthesis
VRILFVAFSNSIHTARWISQLKGQGHDLHLFPSLENGCLHPLLRDCVTFHPEFSSSESGDRAAGLPLFHPLAAGAANLLRQRFLPAPREQRLAKLIKKLQPDLVHSLEFQAAGYLTSRAGELLGGDFPKWMVSNWGSDIYLFGRLPEHQRPLRALLERCDFYLCECRRDLALAQDMGLRGQPLLVIPSGGGLPLARLAPWRAVPPSRRRSLLLKGYQNFAGRALFGLRALELIASRPEIQRLEVFVYLPNPDVELKARLLSEATGLRLRLVPEASHDGMLQLHGKARVSLGLSISDAASTSFLEALTMGAFPVQSDTSCAAEWVVDGVGGLLVPAEDPQQIAAAVLRACSEDALVDEAARLNWQVAKERLDQETIRTAVTMLYAAISEG